MIEDPGLCSFLKRADDPLGFVGDAAGAGQAADDLSFIISDRKLVQRTNRTRDKKRDVARAHEHHIAAFETKAGVDDCVAGVRRQTVSFLVLARVDGGRDADVQRARTMRRFAREVGQPTRGAGQQDELARGDNLTQG